MGGGGELEGFVKFIDLDGIQEPCLAFGKKTLSHSPFPGLPREAFVNKRNALSFFFFFFIFNYNLPSNHHNHLSRTFVELFSH